MPSSKSSPQDSPESAGPAGAQSDTGMQLANHFLIAMPSMLDPIFGGTVVYICEHTDGGALGLIINKSTDISLDVLFDRLELKLEIQAQEGQKDHGRDGDEGHSASPKPVRHPVLFGGPVQVERGFVLHAPHETYSSTMQVNPGIVLTTSRDVLEAAAAGHGPPRMIVTLGCAGWSAGQLEEEIARNGWLTVPADTAIIFDVPVQERFTAALKLLGIDPYMLTGQAGHA